MKFSCSTGCNNFTFFCNLIGIMFYSQHNIIPFLYYICRYDKCRGAAPSGARLQNAVSARLSGCVVRHHARVLAQGPDEAADVRDAAVEVGRLLHHGGLRVQRGKRHGAILRYASQHHASKYPDAALKISYSPTRSKSWTELGLSFVNPNKERLAASASWLHFLVTRS